MRTVPDDFVMNDHRRTGVGRLENADHLRRLGRRGVRADVRPDSRVFHVVAAEKHGLLAMSHTFGTLADGGEFELVYVWLPLFRGDRYVGMEPFEPEDLDVDRARFEELRPRTSPSVSSDRALRHRPAG